VIPLTLGEAVALYAGGPVAALLLFSLVSLFWRRHTERRQRFRHVQCDICGTIYEALPGKSLPRCPNCARSNERVPPSGL
jgi:hypothetical protein